MAFWDKVKGTIFEGEVAAAEVEQAQAPKGVQEPGYKPMGAGMVYPAKSTTHVNQDMVESIRKQTFSKNTALTALITASDSLIDIIPDPVTRLKAAQKMAGGGRGAKELAEAVAIHLNDVNSAEQQFGVMIDQKVLEQVGGLQAQAKNAEQQINSANQEIQNLTNRIQQLQSTVAEATTNMANFQAQASAKEVELRQAGVEFKGAAEVVRQELNTHKQTILSTLG